MIGYKTSEVITKYETPVLSYKDVPYKSALTFNACVVKYKGQYVMLFRNDYGSFEDDILENPSVFRRPFVIFFVKPFREIELLPSAWYFFAVFRRCKSREFLIKETEMRQIFKTDIQCHVSDWGICLRKKLICLFASYDIQSFMYGSAGDFLEYSCNMKFIEANSGGNIIKTDFFVKILFKIFLNCFYNFALRKRC